MKGTRLVARRKKGKKERRQVGKWKEGTESLSEGKEEGSNTLVARGPANFYFSRVPATALGLSAVRIENKIKGSQGMPGKVSVVEGSYWNDSMHDKDFSLSGGTE
jgi:hypothetical protein